MLMTLRLAQTVRAAETCDGRLLPQYSAILRYRFWLCCMLLCVRVRAVVDLVTYTSVIAIIGFGSVFMGLNDHDQ